MLRLKPKPNLNPCRYTVAGTGGDSPNWFCMPNSYTDELGEPIVYEKDGKVRISIMLRVKVGKSTSQ